MALAASVLSCLALGAMATGAASKPGDQMVASGYAERALADRASRSFDRQANPASTPAGDTLAQSDIMASAAQVAANKAAEAARAEQARKAAAAKKAAEQPTPVAGLNQVQMDNAKAIVEAGKALGLSKPAFVAAIMCSLQESKLYNLASSALPESFMYSNQGSGSDHDSIGLFQQRPSSGWGSVKDLMRPSYAATQFYRALMNVSGWQNMALTYAIQAVQVSAFPSAYAQHQGRAQIIVDALT